jgi:hypothetical protein
MAKFKLPTRLRAEPRAAFFGLIKREPLLVLQVEDEMGVNPDAFNEPAFTVKCWRDATVADIEA